MGIRPGLPKPTDRTIDQTRIALGQLGAAWRDQHSLKVVGITGSNGKTMVKEWLTKLLAKDFKVVKSPKSYN